MKARPIAIGALAVAALLIVGGWLVFDRYYIYLPGLVMDLRDPIGPNQPVEWQHGPDAPAQPAGQRPPNVVLIVADDLGWNDITFYGGGVASGTVPTPNIDSIARDGVHISHGYAGSGTCAPSRAAMMTGRYPTRFGFEFTPMPDGMARITARLAADLPRERRRPLITHFEEEGITATGFAEMGLPADEVTIADVLRGEGYRTIHIGKWHLGHENGSAPIDQGFDESLNLAGLLYARTDDPAIVESRQDFDPIDGFLWAVGRHAVNYNEGPRFRPDGYLTEYFTRKAVSAIEANKNRPFFLYLAHWAPHTPLQALKSDYDALGHIEDHTLRVYAAMIRALDRGVGEVLNALRAHGLEDNTIVIFTSDNGGAHYIGLPEINRPYRGWKATFFGGGVRVPYFVKWPARIAPGGEMAGMAHHFDIFPTVAAAARVSPPRDREIDGRNLLPFIEGEESGNPHDVLFWRSGHYQSVIAHGWKLHVTERPDRAWLFHLDTDPTEQHDLAASHPEKVAELKALLAAHNAAQADPLWPSLIEMPVAIDKTLRQPDSEDDDYVYWPN
jgi:arylsulfatase A-like enzyme